MSRISSFRVRKSGVELSVVRRIINQKGRDETFGEKIGNTTSRIFGRRVRTPQSGKDEFDW